MFLFTIRTGGMRIILASAAITLALATFGAAVAPAQKLTNPTKRYYGVVSDESTNQPAGEGKVYVYQDPFPDPVTSSKINPGTGEYSFILDPSNIYRLRVESAGYYATDILLSTPPGDNYEEIQENLTVPAILQDSLLYKGTVFGDGTGMLDTVKLNEVIDFLKLNRQVVAGVSVGGGGAPLDDAGKARVQAFKDYFRARGISLTRLSMKLAQELDNGLYVITVADFTLDKDDY